MTRILAGKLQSFSFVKTYFAGNYFSAKKIEAVGAPIFLVTEHTKNYEKNLIFSSLLILSVPRNGTKDEIPFLSRIFGVAVVALFTVPENRRYCPFI